MRNTLNTNSLLFPYYNSYIYKILILFTIPSCNAAPCPPGDIPFPINPLDTDQKRKVVYECISFNTAYTESMAFLEHNLPSWDRTNKESLGFASQSSPDSLNIGVANYGTNISLEVKATYPWAADVPKNLFYEYVLPFGSVNEGRSNWRPLLLSAVQAILEGEDTASMSTSSVAILVNTKIWGIFPKPIVFKSSQTPLIYDPMSIIAFGYASCTGVSIFLVDALRSIGIASRIAGTPAWNGVEANGNHNWVEVWTGTKWQFIEAGIL